VVQEERRVTRDRRINSFQLDASSALHSAPTFLPRKASRVQVAAASVSHTAVAGFFDTSQLFQKKWLGEPNKYLKNMLNGNTVMKTTCFLVDTT
jgi:hypothetical protein